VSLAQIQYPPPTDMGMEEWFQAHARHHEALNWAFKESQGVVLEDLNLYPVHEKDLDNWLQRHQQMHSALGQVSGVAGTDLTSLDLKDKNASDNWFFQHFLQHMGFAQASGQPV
jgi:hypothetical protein